MPRNMSFMLTTEQIRNRTKTVTRRLGWWQDKNGKRILKQGDILNACVKCMGLKPGERIEKLCRIRVTDVRRERLDWMNTSRSPWYGNLEAIKEGFPELTGPQFVAMFCEHMKCTPAEVVTRIEFEYLEEA